MNKEQQKRFKEIAVKYTKSLSENDYSTELNYQFTDPKNHHLITIYFFSKTTYSFTVQINGIWTNTMQYKDNNRRLIEFNYDTSEKCFDKCLIEIHHFYETWLEDLEKKKQTQ